MKDLGEQGLSIILPVLNEDQIIKMLVRDTLAFATSLVEDVEIIAVNDGSSDATGEILKALSRSIANLKVIDHPQRTGYGGAISTGIRAATKPWILLMDADGQFHIDSLAKVWPQGQDHDVLLGVRQRRADNVYRRIMGRLGNAFTNLLLGRSVKDINCGFKIFKTAHLKPLVLTSRGGCINFEILYRLFKTNPSLDVYQFPVMHYPRTAGNSTGGRPDVLLGIIIDGLKIISGR